MKHFILVLIIFCKSITFSSDIAVVCLAVGEKYKDVVRLGIENKRQYCELHGYDFICGEETLDTTRPIPWSKVILLQKVLENPSYKWVFWTDADSLIMNLGIPLEDFIDENYDFIICKENDYVNSGQFFLRNCEWSHKFLRDVYAHTECINDRWWEQQAVILELKNREVLSHTKIAPPKLFNTIVTGFSNDKKEKFMIHFAGIWDREILKKLFDYYADHVVNDGSNLLGYFLWAHGYELPNDGYLTAAEHKQLSDELALHPEIKTLAEFGLNEGCSVGNFIQNRSDLKIVSLVNQPNDFTKIAKDYLSQKFKGQFSFVGDLPKHSKFDLIFMDGNYSYQDIRDFQKLAHQNTKLWINVFNQKSGKAIQACERQKIIKVEKIHQSEDPKGHRQWIEAIYLP